MLAILDYEAGNQTSVSRALTSLDVANTISADPAVILGADGVIFPGVGAAGQAMGHLLSRGLDQVLRQVVASDKPLLGICLGCQILLDYSEENDTRTLGIIPGTSRRFDPALRDEEGEKIVVPHMGWNSLRRVAPCRLLDGVDEDAEFYFVHSYFVEPDPALVMGVTHHGQDFCSLFGREGLWAAQFHAEKSGRPGLKFFYNFAEYCREKADAQ